MYRKKVITFFSLIIIIFAVAGLVLCGIAFYFVNGFKVPQLSSTQVVSSFNSSVSSVSSLIQESSRALKNVSGTIEIAKDSLVETSDMLLDSSGDLEEIAEAIDFSILGMHPLKDVSKYFLSISEDMEVLASNVGLIAGSVGINIEDIQNISVELNEISENMEGFNEDFAKTSATLPDFGLKTVAYVVIIFMIIQNLLILLIGISLFALNKKSKE
jgi:hypothetical protein